ncbi:MAG: TatD family hydrolase [Taibaiella sp.]|nr:TatD family hydrolase [Taibaiella sp.]
MYIDSHTHLYDEQLLEDNSEMISRAINAGVERMYMPNCDTSTIATMLSIADKWPCNCFPMMGLHPTYVKENYKQELSLVADWLSKRKFYAIGEIGLDFYWDLTYKQQQIESFNTQIDLALEYKLPIVIHSRESTQACIDIVKQKQNGNLKGIFHCFSGTLQEAEEIISLGFYLGIGGAITYKKSTLPDIIHHLSLNNIVLETDAPYLAPIPYRGKRNESGYIPLIAQYIAAIKEVSVQDVEKITTLNAVQVFGTILSDQ